MIERFKIIGTKILGLNGIFSVQTIAKETKIDPEEVRVVLDRMAREGLLERYELRKVSNQLRGRPGAVLVYQVSKKVKLQNRISPRMREETAQDRMWKVMRYLRTFSISDVIRLAEAKRESARWFVKMLRRAGYVRSSKPGGPGVEWTLIKDPGPRRPYVSRKQKAESSGQ